MGKPVKIPWYGDSEYAKSIINEMNQTLFKDTDLKAKLFTKTVGKGLLECEEYYIVITRGLLAQKRSRKGGRARRAHLEGEHHAFGAGDHKRAGPGASGVQLSFRRRGHYGPQ